MPAKGLTGWFEDSVLSKGLAGGSFLSNMLPPEAGAVFTNKGAGVSPSFFSAPPN